MNFPHPYSHTFGISFPDFTIREQERQLSSIALIITVFYISVICLFDVEKLRIQEFQSVGCDCRYSIGSILSWYRSWRRQTTGLLGPWCVVPCSRRLCGRGRNSRGQHTSRSVRRTPARALSVVPNCAPHRTAPCLYPKEVGGELLYQSECTVCHLL